MCKMCDLRDDMQRIVRKLSVSQERIKHCQDGFMLAAKTKDDGQMQRWREDLHRAQDEALDLVKEAYANLDEQFEFTLNPDEDRPPPIH